MSGFINAAPFQRPEENPDDGPLLFDDLHVGAVVHAVSMFKTMATAEEYNIMERIRSENEERFNEWWRYYQYVYWLEPRVSLMDCKILAYYRLGSGRSPSLWSYPRCIIMFVPFGYSRELGYY